MRFILLLFYSLLVFSCSTSVNNSSSATKIESKAETFGLEYEEEIECEDDEIPCDALSLWVSESFDEADFEEAINNANQAIACNCSVSNAAEIYSGLARSYAELVDNDKASNAIKKGLSYEPENIELIGLATQHALNRAELDVAKEYISQAEGDSNLDHLRLQIAHFEGKKGTIESFEKAYKALEDPDEKLRLQLSVVSRAIDDLVEENHSEQLDILERMIQDILPPEEASVRQIVLTSLVVMKHSIALQKGDYSGAAFLRDQLISIASEHDALVQFLSAKASVAASKPNTMEFALTIKEVERISEHLKQPLYKASLQLLLCEALLETEPFRA